MVTDLKTGSPSRNQHTFKYANTEMIGMPSKIAKSSRKIEKQSSVNLISKTALKRNTLSPNPILKKKLSLNEHL